MRMNKMISNREHDSYNYPLGTYPIYNINNRDLTKFVDTNLQQGFRLDAYRSLRKWK